MIPCNSVNSLCNKGTYGTWVIHQPCLRSRVTIISVSMWFFFSCNWYLTSFVIERRMEFDLLPKNDRKFHWIWHVQHLASNFGPSNWSTSIVPVPCQRHRQVVDQNNYLRLWRATSTLKNRTKKKLTYNTTKVRKSLRSRYGTMVRVKLLDCLIYPLGNPWF